MAVTTNNATLKGVWLSNWSPALLFRNGEQGVWYDPSDLNTMFQDSAATTPVTAVEQPVGLIRDKSGRGNNASQSTSASRPVLSARYNVIRNSTTPWTQTSSGFDNLTLTNQGTYGPDGGTLVYKSILSSTGSSSYCYSNSDQTIPANTVVTFSQRVKAGEYEYVLIKGLTGSERRYAVLFNASSGAFVKDYTKNTPANTSYSSKDLGNGWWEFSISFSMYTSSTPEWGCLPSPNNNPNLDTFFDIITRGDGTSAIYLAGSSITVANDGVAIPYQRVNTSTDYDSNPNLFPYYLKFDGTDDWLQTSSVNFTGTANATVCCGARKLSDATRGMIVELTDGGFDKFMMQGPDTNSTSNWGYASVGNTGSTTRGISAITYVAPITNVLLGTSTVSVPSSVELLVNTVSAGTNTNSQGGTVYANAPLYIGRRGGSTLPFNGRIYSLIIRGASSTASEIANTQKWVNGKTKAY